MNEPQYRTVDDEIAYNNYKLTADKILQLLSQIREDPSASAKRWVWELLQNAKDVPNRFGKVSVEIELVSPETLKFRHNGDCFSTKNITGLVQQVSSKDSQNLEGQTGKFGTGFICTHLLSDIIDVEGIVKYMGIYRRFKIVLDRSGYRSEDLLPRIESTLEELRHIETAYEVVNNYEENRTEQSFDTVFTYHLTTQEKQESAVAGLEDLVNTMPITLVTQSNKIKQVRVIDRVKNTNVVYTCDSKELGNNVKLSYVQIDNQTKTYLSYITDEVALTTEVNIINGTYEVVKRDSKQPVLYRDFPLIGSEKFYFPYTLNGFGFNPTERRNGLLLNSADHPNCISNRAIIDKAVDAVLIFNDWLITNYATNRYLLASSRIPKSSEEYSENVAAPWIKNLQETWRKRLLQTQLVETDNGTNLLINLSVPLFTPTSTKEVNEDFFNLLEGQYIGRGVLPAIKYLHGWIDVVRPEYETWGTKLKYEKDDFLKDLSDLQNLSALASKISKTNNETITWLNKVYRFLIDQNMLNDFDNYAIIPNQRGEFKLLKELYSDHTSRIPSILKDIYNSVNQDNATIQHMLMDADVEASIFGNTLRAFSLKEMIDKLNEYIKSGTSIVKNGTNIDITPTVAYKIISLYPVTEDSIVLQKRKTMYNFCCAYLNMDVYTEVNTTDFSLWKEADSYWFNNSYIKIESQKDAANFAKNFFLNEKNLEEALIWLNDYLKFYRDNSWGDFIKEKSVFPRQLSNNSDNGKNTFQKLTDLRYDDNVPEAFKTLGNFAKDITHKYDYCRHFLLHKTILGYESHNPFTVKDLYEYVKKRFDESNDETKEVIARKTICILVKQENSEPVEKKLYDFCKVISGQTFNDFQYVENHIGFYWGFAQEFYIKFICKKIAESVNIEGFKKLNSCFENQDNNALILWIDSLIEFLYTYKEKKYWPIISDKEKGYGIWLNQNNNFCKFQDVRKDEGIPEELKEIAASNVHINYDFKENLFTLESKSCSYLETEPMTLNEIAEFIDNKIKEYNGKTQDNNFRSLVFAVGKLCNNVNGLEDIMTYFKETKNSLIVWSLGEGETLDLVGSIVQQGDEKLRLIKELLERNSLEDLRNIQNTIDTKDDIVTEFVSTDPSGEKSTVKISLSDTPYAGLSINQMHDALFSAKKAVESRLVSEGFEFTQGLCEDSYGDINGVMKDGKEYPLVVHSYKNQNRPFQLTTFDWEQLAKPNSMLWVNTSNGLKCIPFYELAKDRGRINISFDCENFEIADRSKALAQVLKYYKGLHFDFGTMLPSCSNQIELFNKPEKPIKEVLGAKDDSEML